jgi:hypothetical protein
MFRSLTLSFAIFALAAVASPHFARAADDQLDQPDEEEVYVDDGDSASDASLAAFTDPRKLPEKVQAGKEADSETPVEETEAPKTKTAKKHVAKAGTKSSGKFVVTKSECKMMRSPASEGEPMIVVKAEKKIWVENVDQKWVKGFNKAGDAGFIAKDCVQ